MKNAAAWLNDSKHSQNAQVNNLTFGAAGRYPQIVSMTRCNCESGAAFPHAGWEAADRHETAGLKQRYSHMPQRFILSRAIGDRITPGSRSA